MNSLQEEFYNFYELQEERKILFERRKLAMQLLIFPKEGYKKMYIICYGENRSDIYNHSGDDGKEDPPVPIPNTEVKLFYAESTCRELPGGQVIAAFQTKRLVPSEQVVFFYETAKIGVPGMR